MRIPAWMFIIGVVLLMAITAILSLVAFNVARQIAIDLGNSGVSSGASAGMDVATLPTPTRVSVQSASTRLATVSGAGVGAVATAVSTSIAPAATATLNGLPIRMVLYILLQQIMPGGRHYGKAMEPQQERYC